MVNLTRDEKGRTRARLLDIVPGRSGRVYRDWLQERGEAFTAGVKVATPFQGYKNAIDDELQDAVAVVDAFHIAKLGGRALEEVRRRVQQETLGHRGHKDDPPFLAYFTSGRANNGGAEAKNGLIELHRRVARGFRNLDYYRLRMLLVGGAFTDPRLT